MSLILAIDSSSEACSCALNLNNTVYESFEVIPRQHAQKLLPMINSLLLKHGITLAELDAIAVGQGPGSFTGLRIAIGVAQGLAYGAQLPVVCVSDLAAIAWHIYLESQQQYLFSCIDARISEVYWGAYQCNEKGPLLLGEEGLGTPEELKTKILDGAAQWTGVGSGMAFFDKMNIEIQHKITHSHPNVLPHAGDIASLASIYFAQGKAKKPEQITPVYLRDKVTHN